MTKTEKGPLQLMEDEIKIIQPDIEVSGVFHPSRNDKGERVIISCPTATTPMSAFDDPDGYAVMLPNGQAPESLNGIAFQPRTPDWRLADANALGVASSYAGAKGAIIFRAQSSE